MDITESVFDYELIRRFSNTHRTLGYIVEELNRGLSFSISRNRERVVRIQGKRKYWVRCEIEGDLLRLFVDDDFFYSDCIIEQILTSLWANLLDFCGLRLFDFSLSRKIIERLLQPVPCNAPVLVKEGPYFGIVLKPSNALTLQEKIKIATDFARLGGSFIKEDETYLVDKKRITSESRKIQEEINNAATNSFYVPNITPYITDYSFINELSYSGVKVVMVNFLIAGLPTLKKVRENCRSLLFWGHRVGYETIKRYISMRAVGLLSSYCGINLIHVGTPLLLKDMSIKRTLNIVEGIRYVNKSTLPVFTKTSAEIVPDLRRIFSDNIVIMACGSLRKKGELDYRRMENWLSMG
jgi:ribulose 1,5-bisphosphate carboxylase large subunit-like protein